MARVDGTPEDGTVRPVVKVEIHSQGNPPLPIKALVDSGADLTMIPIAIGEALAAKPFDAIGPIAGYSRGLGGNDKGVPYRILPDASVSYDGFTFARRVTIGPVPRVVVGQSDFLAFFDVAFFWGANPKFMTIERSAAVPRGSRSAPNPTIRPKEKRRKRR
jgi:hypothetical protein